VLRRAHLGAERATAEQGEDEPRGGEVVLLPPPQVRRSLEVALRLVGPANVREHRGDLVELALLLGQLGRERGVAGGDRVGVVSVGHGR
jgi:hypothetical protein